MSRVMDVRAVVHHVHKRFTMFAIPDATTVIVGASSRRYFWAYDNATAELLSEGNVEFIVWRDAVLKSNRLRIERKSVKGGGSPALAEGAL